MPLHAASDLAALRLALPAPAARSRAGSLPRAALSAALIAITLILALGSTGVLAATTVTPKCDGTNLRTGPGTSYAKKTSVNIGTKLNVVTTVSGGSWTATCGTSLSGSSWYKISQINGRSVSSLYGVTYLYGASKLFTIIPAPTASPTKAPTAAPTAAATAAPSVAASSNPAATGGAIATTAPGSPAPSVTPAPTAPTATAAPTATPAPTPFPPLTFPKSPITLASSITIYGRGYGHGVGMSQYGAYGRAVAGQTAAQIMAAYYQGTTFGKMANSQVRVLVLDDFKASSTTPATVYGRGATWTVDGVAATFPADARLRFTPTVSGTTTTWKITVTASDGSALYSGAAPSSIRVRSGSGTTLQLWSTPSAYDRFRGVLRLIGRTDGTTLVDVVNELPIESYLRGVVPAEIPASWPVESVKAQAIAARSYAANHRHPGTGSFDFHNDTRSQMYLGVLVEKSASNSAISATVGQVVLTSTGGIANTMFHSSDGGWTENNENVFVSSTGAKTAGVYSYLRGVSDRLPDGSSYDQTSPYYGWKTTTYTLSQIQAWFAADSRTNVGTLVALDLHDRGVSGRLISVTLIGANGSTKKVSGDVFRSVFNAHRPSGDPMMRNTLFSLSPIP
ncbi:MAG TPA: SpoIID/LytB domain-containing protein [Candidatus Limnocylindrales bacterium]|nr:SpoIID/LytB domain-containing protein [Candidatus Limnocylindrales bacterium]